MGEDCEKGYLFLLSFPEMVENLIRLFVAGERFAKLEFSTLEKVTERDISVDLLRRERGAAAV